MDTEHIVNIDFLGGAMEVGGSAVLVQLNGFRVLLDCGIRQKAGVDPLPNLHRIQERGGLDAIVISHAHMDHTGSLPVISREYPNARIYTTSMTIDLTRVLLYDSIKLMNRQEEGIPVYAQNDVEQTLGRMLALRYEQPMEILPGITLTLYQAGHIAGAACVYLQSKDGTVFYSGDFSSFSQNTIEGIRIPRLRPDIAIVESTYGDRLHSNRQVEERQLIETVAECIARKGKMLIPTFALGRAQEVLLILRRAMNKGEIPKVKIFVDGMVRDMNTAYARNPWFLKNALARRIERGNDVFYSEEIQPVAPMDKREELLKSQDPVIFVASSGMLTGGPSVEYAKKIAPMENGYIVITGYQDEEAPGRQIVELLETSDQEERFLTLDNTRIPVHCTLKKAGLSAHGDKSEIESLLTSLSARNVFLVHGDKEVIPALAKGLQLDYRTRIFTPQAGDSEQIYLRSPRQQLKKSFPYTMQKQEELGGKDKEFYAYLEAHYPGRKFTIGDMAFIWYGKLIQEEEVLEKLQQSLLESSYFTQDLRRLFLFRCKTVEEMEEEKESGTITIQQLEQMAKECFAGFPYKKLGYYVEKEEVLLQFDFPREVRETFDDAAQLFEEKTGWRAVRNLEPNEHAMQTLLQKYLGTAMQKVSIRKMEETVTVRLGRNPGKEILDELTREFEEKTGYFLLFDGIPKESEDGYSNREKTPKGAACEGGNVQCMDDFFLPGGVEKQEQNLAFSCIDMEFEGEKYAPYKKSIMTDKDGKYIQLSFLSPALGYRQAEILKRIAAQIGWRIRIAPGVNVNAITAMAMQLCQEYKVDLKKTPSYKPGTQTIVLKTFSGCEKTEEVCRKLEEETGIHCTAEMA